MTLDEAQTCIEVLRDDDADLIVHPVGGGACEFDTGASIPNTEAWLYIGWKDLSRGAPDAVAANPGAHGWVRFVLPEETDGVLIQSALDIRTVWLTHDNPSGVEIFNRIARRVRPLLRRPTWVWSVLNGTSRELRDVGHTVGATGLYEAGGAWMQRGVANLRFGPTAPSV